MVGGGSDGQEEEIREWVRKPYTQVKRSTNSRKQFNGNTCCVEVSFRTLFFVNYVLVLCHANEATKVETTLVKRS